MSPAVSACAIHGNTEAVPQLRLASNRSIHAAANHSASLRNNAVCWSGRRLASQPQTPPLDNAISLPPTIHGNASPRPVMG